MAIASNSNNFFLYFAILFYVIQSGISITLALIGIQVQECKINILQNRDFKSCEWKNWWETIYLWTYLTYFRRLRLEDGWSDRVLSTHRTYKWILIYLIMGTFWMFTSLSLFVVVVGRRHRKGNARIWFLYSWIIITMVVICTDLMASVQYVFDIRHSSDSKQYFEFIGYNGNFSNDHIRGTMDQYFYAAPIFMSLVFSRGVTFWILNVVILIYALKKRRIFRVSEKTEEVAATSANNSEQIRTTDEKTDDTVSQSSLSRTATVLSTTQQKDEPSYVPWVNVLYVPSTCADDYVEKVAEHYDEHHYEHVTCPNEIIPGTAINIEIPRGPAGNDGLFRGVPAYQKSWTTEPGIMRIDIGNICVQISRKNSHVCCGTPPTKYPNLRIVRLPKATKCSDPCCSICNSTEETVSQ